MDPITHAVLGASIGYLAAGNTLGRRAALVGLVAGMAPDLDHFVSSREDPLMYVQYHRHFTHSYLFSAVGALLSILPWMGRREFRDQWKLFWWAAWLAYLSHILLDASTTYGTQLYWPFSNARVGWDLISIIDPLFTGLLAAGLLPAVVRRQQGWVAGALGAAAAYLVLGAVQHWRAGEMQEKIAAARGHIMIRREVMPTLGNQLVWRSLYLSEGRIYCDRIRVGWFSPARFREGSSLPVVTAGDLNDLERAGNARTRGFDRFAWFSSGWVARSPSQPEVIGDMRYSLSTDAFDPIWGIRFYERNGTVGLEWVERSADRRIHASELWSEVTGRDPRYRRPPARAM